MATTRFDAAEYLDSPEAQAEYLSEFLEDGSADEIRHAINTIARARHDRNCQPKPKHPDDNEAGPFLMVTERYCARASRHAWKQFSHQ